MFEIKGIISLYCSRVYEIYKQKQVYRLFAVFTNETAFIGGTDTHNEGEWVWLDETPLDFTNWASGEPAGGSGENCLEMVPNKNGTWNDVPCESSHAVKAAICSMDAGQSDVHFSSCLVQDLPVRH